MGTFLRVYLVLGKKYKNTLANFECHWAQVVNGRTSKINLHSHQVTLSEVAVNRGAL